MARHGAARAQGGAAVRRAALARGTTLAGGQGTKLAHFSVEADSLACRVLVLGASSYDVHIRGGGGMEKRTQKGRFREYITFPNADKGTGVKNPKMFADIFIGSPPHDLNCLVNRRAALSRVGF